MTFLVFINTIIFIFLSFLHMYWALGGNWGMSGVLPTLNNKQHIYKPGFLAKMGVSSVMGGFALITIGNTGVYGPSISLDFFRYATAAIGLLFSLRAMGDFRYMGFFKKATGTLFSKNDTKYYTPLCVIVALICFMIAMIA